MYYLYIVATRKNRYVSENKSDLGWRLNNEKCADRYIFGNIENHIKMGRYVPILYPYHIGTVASMYPRIK